MAEIWPMSPRSVTLVVGTTPDYVDWIRSSRPGQAIFLTDPALRERATEERPAPEEEVLGDLADHELAGEALAAHLARWQLELDGIACFDCESMALAAELAQNHALPYPSADSIDRCRDKHRTKTLWRDRNIRCPAVTAIRTPEDASRFAAATAGPVVLKPAAGSGSELVFLCRDDAECRASLREIELGLRRRATNRLYRRADPERPAVVAEEFVAGREYSCDFLVADGRTTLVRLARKLRAPDGPLGTIQAYVLTDPPPAGIAPADFSRALLESAAALGVTRGLCMLDFLTRGEELVLLELTPRPGGDCLPWLLRHARGLDILGLNLDFARCKPIRLATDSEPEPHVGLRVHAARGGKIASIDDAALEEDPRVRAVKWLRGPGHVVRMPPEDYDSWLLGQAIFVPDDRSSVEDQCRDLLGGVRVEIGG